MKLKKCLEGYNCGNTCISKKLKCSNAVYEAGPALSSVAETLSKPNTINVFKALYALRDSENAENLDKLKQFVISKQIQAVFYGQGQPLIKNIPEPREGSNGYTSRKADFVVVKAKSFQPEPELIKLGVELAIEGPEQWSFSSSVETLSPSSKAVTTYLHEMGHQVHYKGGWETSILDEPEGWQSFTKYGSASDTEYVAEHFVAWAIAPAKFKQADPVGYAYIDRLVNNALL